MWELTHSVVVVEDKGTGLQDFPVFEDDNKANSKDLLLNRFPPKSLFSPEMRNIVVEDLHVYRPSSLPHDTGFLGLIEQLKELHFDSVCGFAFAKGTYWSGQVEFVPLDRHFNHESAKQSVSPDPFSLGYQLNNAVPASQSFS